MQKYEIKVLGNDKQMYEVADFVAAGKSYNDAIGIVFGTPIIGLRVLAFDSWLGQWSKTDRVLTEPRNESQAVQILCGLEDTKRIVKEQTNLDELTAAKWCWSYQKSVFQWYLPSVMELGALFLVRDQVNNAMKQLGCDSDCLLPTKNSDGAWVWSSSEYSQNYSWYADFGNGGFYPSNKYYSSVVRAVAALSQAPSPSLFSGEAKSKGSEMSDEDLVTMLRNRGYAGELTKTLTV
jgi:hypothetical protein